MSGGPWPELAEALGAQFESELWRAALADVPYTRPDYPQHLLFTAAQWESYIGWNELQDELERKYGRLVPQSAASVFALARRIW